MMKTSLPQSELLSEGVGGKVGMEPPQPPPPHDRATARGMKLAQEEEVIEELEDLTYSWDDPDIQSRTCSVCGYIGKWSSEMIRHKRVHTNERPFRCKVCSRTSKWKADLIRHLNRMHGVQVVSKNTRIGNQNGADDLCGDPPTLVANKPVADGVVVNSSSSKPMVGAATVDGSINGTPQPLPMIRFRIETNGSKESGMHSVKIVRAKSVQPAAAAAAAVVNQTEGNAPPAASATAAGAVVVANHQSEVSTVNKSFDGQRGSSSSSSPAAQSENKLKAVLDKYAIIGAPTFGNHRWLRCRLCPYCTWDRHTFRVHTQKHENKKLHQCSECGYRSNWSSDVHKHIRFKKATHSKAYVVKLSDSTTANGPEESDSSSISPEPPTSDPPLPPSSDTPGRGGSSQPLLKDDGDVGQLSPSTPSEDSIAVDDMELASGQSTIIDDDDSPEPSSYCVALEFEDVCDVMADFMDIINAAVEEQKQHGDDATMAMTQGFSVNELPALCNSNGQLLVRVQGVRPVQLEKSPKCVGKTVSMKQAGQSPNDVVPATEKRSEIRKIQMDVDGHKQAMWQCRYCPHVSKRRANVRMHEKKHFKVTRRQSVAQQSSVAL